MQRALQNVVIDGSCLVGLLLTVVSFRRFNLQVALFRDVSLCFDKKGKITITEVVFASYSINPYMSEKNSFVIGQSRHCVAVN